MQYITNMQVHIQLTHLTQFRNVIYRFFFAESLLNFHEDVRRKTWTPIAWLPIYDAAKSKRPTQGYESDAARVMRLHHDCWRRILGR